MTTSSTNNSVFRGFFEKQKLTGPASSIGIDNLGMCYQLRIRQEEGQSVSSYVLKMKGYIDNLERLGYPVTLGLGVSLILINLRKEYDGFVQNYNMHRMGKTVNELHAMLKLYEQTLPKSNTPALNAIRAGKVQKGNKHKKSHSQKGAKGQNQGKGKFVPKPNIPPPPKRENPAKDFISSGAGGLGIFVIELNNILNRSWIYDTGCGTHICNTTHGLRASRKLKPGALSLYVGNGQRKAVEAIGAFYLSPYWIRDCFEQWDGIFKIDLSNSLTNESSVYAVSNKRAKLNLDTALLWHCRLGHISKKCIEKLQHDGLLNSSDLTACEKCVSCMSGKMARKPYTHQVERAKDLLRLIHTDVCGLFKIMSRKGASYFVTFTNDFSRYGYVYLLKHKHEVFETFKVFQKEVKNQLGKTIKSLRFDRGGEYMSQEFLDHLKDHGIIAHRTPPYTPQHNGVSKRKNRTLLDMGCEALVKRDTLTKPDKLEPRAIKCIFVGYPKKTMGYSFYYLPENKVLVARNAEFLKNSLIDQEASGSLEDLEIIQEEDTHPSLDTSLNHKKEDLEINEPQSDIVPIRRSTRTRHEPDRMCLYIDAEEHELGDLREPANYKAALLDPKSKKWLNAMNVEYIRAIRILIAIAAYYDYEIWQMDVKTAFLNGYLNEEVYMEKPEGFVNSKYPNCVYAGYLMDAVDLKSQTGYVFILNGGVVDWKSAKQSIFATSSAEANMYCDNTGAIAIANESGITKGSRHFRTKVHYLRQVIEFGDIMQEKVHTDDNLADPFTKALAFPKHSEHTKNIRMLPASSLIAYIKKILKRYCMENSKRGSIPMQEKLKLSKSQGASTPAELKRMQNVPYASATGYVFVFNGGVVDWKCAKQNIFATSSAEAEYIAAFDASKEAVWVRKFISGLSVIPTIEEPIIHYLREVIEFGDLKLEKFHSDDNLADPFTKALAFPKHSEHIKNIGMPPASSLM
nr:hypothetical protein [Tanacetum cinerariifolium]